MSRRLRIGLALLILLGGWPTRAAAQTTSLTRAQTPLPTTMQPGATGTGNGTALVVSGYQSAILDVTCATCAGGTMINFEGTLDNTVWSAVYASRLNSSATIVSTTLVGGLFQIQTGGALRSVRARISNYSSGTVTVLGYPGVGGITPLAVNVASVTGTVTVDGTGGTFPISATTLPLPTLASTSTKQSDGSQKTQIVDGSGNVIASTSNNLNVQCANCSGSGASAADEASFTAGTSTFAPAGGFFQTTATNNALTTGQQGMFQATAQRALFTNLRNAAGTEIGTATTPVQVTLANTGSNATAVLVTGTGGTFPVSGSVAHDGAASAVNPLLVGCYASAAAPTDVSADTDATRLWCLRSGAVAFQPTYAGVLATTGNGASGTGVPRVTLASDSTGNIATIGTSVTPGTAAANLGKAEDAAHTSADTGVFMLGVANEANTQLANTDGDYTVIKTDRTGQQFFDHCPSAAMTRGTATTTGTSDTSLVAASGSASLKTYIYSAQIVNTGSTAALITFKDGNGGTTLGYTIAPASGSGSNIVFEIPLVTTANTALYFAAGSSSTTVYASAQGCKAP